MNQSLKFISAIIVLVFFLLPQVGKTDDFNAETFCPSFTKNIDAECDKLSKEQCQEILAKCEKFYQTQSEKYQSEIKQIQTKKRTLENEISTLTTKIRGLDNNIYKNNLIIKDLNFQIGDTEKSIDQSVLKIEDVQKELSLLLQLRYEEDQKSLLEVFLSEETLTGFVDNLMALESLSKQTQELLENIKGLKLSLEDQKETMVSEKSQLEETQILVRLQKEESKELQTEKENILEITKGQESLYQQYLQETEAKAQEIRKKIFELAQVPTTEALTLEQAYILAKEVERITGARAALLLGLLKVESDIGNNVGQCNCAGAAYCRYPDIGYKEIMTQRHWSYFEQITKELGLNPNSTPVSCAINGGKVQWGGAMGPAQFMPETWLGLGYKERVEKITGVKPANPWRVKDAFLAAGLYLYDFGAAWQTEYKEIGAVRAYLCGTTKLTYTCRISGGNTYTYNVMKYAGQFQDYIDKGILK